MDKKGEELKPVSNSVIVFAWILLFILVFLLIGVTYLRFFGSNLFVSSNDYIPVDNISDVDRAILTQIVDNFNSDSKIEDYKKQRITINASLKGDVISVVYKSSSTKTYEFTFNNHNLTIQNSSGDLDFEIVYSMLIYANQKRLSNNINIDNYLKDFFENDIDIDGISMNSSEANEITYVMNIDKVIGINNSLDSESGGDNSGNSSY